MSEKRQDFYLFVAFKLVESFLRKTNQMKKLLFILAVCTLFSCKKDVEKTLTSKKWTIESTSVSPAMTIGSKTSTDYIELMGPNSCAATMKLLFANDGTFTSGANGALCDMISKMQMNRWTKNGNQIILSTSPDSPMSLKGGKLTQTVVMPAQNGVVYTFVHVYKAIK